MEDCTPEPPPRRFPIVLSLIVIGVGQVPLLLRRLFVYRCTAESATFSAEVLSSLWLAERMPMSIERPRTGIKIAIKRATRRIIAPDWFVARRGDFC